MGGLPWGGGGTLQPMFSRLRRPEVTPEQLVYGLRALELGGEHVMVHASLRSFGHLRGGVGALLGALQAEAATVVAPAFSYSTLLSRPEQPPRPFARDTRVSRDIGALPQAMVGNPQALRSFHPTLSFVALGECAAEILAGQSLDNPYAPVGALADRDGLTLLIGVEHSSNTAVHYGEHLAGLPLLTRYVSVGGAVHPCAFPSCSADFERLAPRFPVAAEVQIGGSRLRAYRIRALLGAVQEALQDNPEATLCRQAHCRCQQVRAAVRAGGLLPRPHLYPPVPPQPLPPLLGIMPAAGTSAGGRHSKAPARPPPP